MTQKKWFPFFKNNKKQRDTPILPNDIEKIRQKAQQGHHLEQVLWGKILLNSNYIPPDQKQARTWFSIAANAGYGPAWNMLGRCAHFGWGADAPDLLQAAQYYEKAAALGDEWGRYNLGILYMRGIGVDQDLKKALKLFRHAAQNGHAKSMNIFARFLEEGWEIQQDQKAAIEWYKRSAESGDYRGQHNYATFLIETGRAEEALNWWEKALPDATSDILLAMKVSLCKLNQKKASVLYDKLQKRLLHIYKT